jgi:HSP20 family protein
MTMSMRRSSGQGQVERWRPFREFEDLYSEVDRLVQSVIGGVARDGVWTPAADITETDNAYIVEIELPGVKREDVDVQLQGNELVVTGELKKKEREGLLRRRARKVGEFEFRATLPGYLRQDEIEATLAHGVLTVYVPKAESTQSRQIEVTDSNAGPSR